MSEKEINDRIAEIEVLKNIGIFIFDRVIKNILDENKKLKEQIELMKCCGNCTDGDKKFINYKCKLFIRCTKNNLCDWKLRKEA